MVEPRAMIQSKLDTRRGGPLLITIMVHEHREDAVGGGGSRQCQIHTHTYTQSVPRDTQDGWSLGQGSDAILTQLSVAPH